MARKPTTPRAKPLATSKAPSLKMVEFTPATVNEAIAASGASKSGKLLMVAPDQIYVMPGFNLRITDSDEYKAGILDLAESIKAEGFYDTQPLGCFPAEVDGETRLVLISGHRRLEAALKAIADGAEIERLPVVLKRPGSSDLDLAVSLHKENTGVQPSMMERAVLVHRMERAGMDPTEIAARLNVTARHISDLKVIIAAPRPVRELIKQGKISPSEAVIQLRKDPTGDKILEAAEKAAKRAAEKVEKGEKAKDSKVTRQTIEGGDQPRVRMQTHRLNFQATEGGTFLYEDVEPFLSLLGEDWFKPARKKGERIALEQVEIEVKIRRPKSEEEAAAEAAPAPAAAAAPRKAAGKKGAAVKPEPVEVDEDLTDDDDDLGADAPDLAAADIADPIEGDDLAA